MRYLTDAPSTWGRALLTIIALSALLVVSSALAQTTSGTSSTGNTLFNSTFNCHNCHTAGSANRFNANNAGGHIAYANTQGMGGTGGTAQQYADIAAYINSQFAGLAFQNVTFQTALGIAIPNFALNTTYGDYIGLRVYNSPSRGSVSFSGTTATYTPFTSQCGSDSFTYEAYRSGATPQGTGTSNLRSASLNISNPAAPNISSSAGTMSGSYNSVIGTFFPSNTGGPPYTYGISGTLPIGLNFNTANGSISGTPTQIGTFNVTVTAYNCFNTILTGQSGSRAISVTISKATPAAIGFAALPPKLTSDSPFSVFATGGGSTSPVTFTASGVCSSSGTNGSTITLTGSMGTCTVTANQAGDTNYLAAAPVVQNFSVVAPGEPFPPIARCLRGSSRPVQPMPDGLSLQILRQTACAA